MKMKCFEPVGHGTCVREEQGVCLDIALGRVEAFSELVSGQLVERLGPIP